MDLAELKQRLDQEFNDFSFGKAKFPLLFHTGLHDASIHSAGISYLVALGIELGLPALAEYPITVHSDERWKNFGKLLPDSIWFHPHTNQPWIAIEFERFEKGDEIKIQDKAQNLALSYYQSRQTIEICILIYWLRSGMAPRSIDPVLKIFKLGFSMNSTQVPPPTCQLLLYKFVLSQVNKTIQSDNQLLINPQVAHGVAVENTARLSICSATKVYK